MISIIKFSVQFFLSKHSNLDSVMYHGEANITQEDLDNFLAVAEDLR